MLVEHPKHIGAETSDMEGADVDMWSSGVCQRRLEQRGQGEGWLWEDDDGVGEGCCLHQETQSEQSLVLCYLVLEHTEGGVCICVCCSEGWGSRGEIHSTFKEMFCHPKRQ